MRPQYKAGHMLHPTKASKHHALLPRRRRPHRHFLRNCVDMRSAFRAQARPYSITSSVRTKSEPGIVMPSALAALKLITSSNMVDC